MYICIFCIYCEELTRNIIVSPNVNNINFILNDLNIKLKKLDERYDISNINIQEFDFDKIIFSNIFDEIRVSNDLLCHINVYSENIIKYAQLYMDKIYTFGEEDNIFND